MKRLILRIRCSLIWRHAERTFVVHPGDGTTLRVRGCPCGKRTVVERRPAPKYPLPAKRMQVID